MSPDDLRHGTSTAYAYFGCRCESCRKASGAYWAQHRAKGVAEGDPRHGTDTGYGFGCRCDDCRAAHAAAQRKRAESRGGLPEGDTRHGTLQAYVNYRCRCDACRQAAKRYNNIQKAERFAKGLPEGDPRHGTVNGYSNWGCRCLDCTAADRAAARARSAAKKPKA